MLFAFGKSINQLHPEGGGFRPGVLHLLIAVFVCLTVIIAGTQVINLQEREIDVQRKVDLLVSGSALQARLTRELNSVLFLTGGMSSYLVVRHADMQPAEVDSILAALYRDSRHVRHFAVAVGHRVTYIYPAAGNEKVIGLNYPEIADQWPAIKRAIDTGKPVLIGPLDLVQGGSGLIYRVPIFVGDSYWGLLSSVIDADSLLGSALSEVAASGIAVAIRGKDGAGLQGAVFRGDAALFDDPDAQRIDVAVPGGKWVIALRAAAAPKYRALWLMHGLVWLLALTLGWSALVVLMQRGQLARLALFDALTELPNRLLVEDRVDRAMSGLRRDPEKTCLLLFIDLDGFKRVNDRLGHRAGDVVLENTARQISAAVRETDTVGRWGGDEFIVFMENVERSQIDGLIEKIRQAVELPTRVAHHQVTVGASIGRAFAPDDGTTLDELVRAADERMYADKNTRNAAR